MIKGPGGQRPCFLLLYVSLLYTRHISASCPKKYQENVEVAEQNERGLQQPKPTSAKTSPDL